MHWGHISKAILASATIVCTLAQAAEAQYAWQPGFEWPGGKGLDNTVFALVAFDDGGGPALYAGGAFTMADGVAANSIAKWDGMTWTPLGSGANGGVLALTVFDDGTGPALYAGGYFTTAGGIAANHVAKWDGAAWTPLSTGIGGDNPFVDTIAVFDDGTGAALYVGGYFRSAGGAPANSIARWDGTGWAPLDSGTTGPVSALTVFDDGTGPALYAGGNFGMAGSVSANNIAKWDGTAWTALSEGIAGFGGVRALTVFDGGTGPSLYAGGSFSMAGGTAAANIAKWDGAMWASLGSGISSPHALLFALDVFDDGNGPALYAGGIFSVAGDLKANNIAKWDGTNWAPLGSGTSDDGVSAIVGFDDGSSAALYVGGYFTTAGGVRSNNMAKWAAR